MNPGPPVRLVIPCYNEAERLNPGAFLHALELVEGLGLVMVDDGSRDATPEVLADMARRAPGRITTLRPAPHGGKAAAVRRGVLAALETGPEIVGYWDADLAAPLTELPGMLEVFRRHPLAVAVIGARVGLLGRSIERRAWRHYLGRVGATLISLALKLPVYDTQCGAKLFRAGELTRQVFREPFRSRWLLDVEILFRFLALGGPGFRPEEAIFEYPLEAWREVGGSKVGPVDYPRAMAELYQLWREYDGRGGRRKK